MLLGAIVVVAAALIVHAKRDDELSFDLVAPRSFDDRSTRFEAAVDIGCNADERDGRVDDYSVEYGDRRITVTFTGNEDGTGDDCLTSVRREVVLSEPLGDRALCSGADGLQIWPQPRSYPIQTQSNPTGSSPRCD